MRISDWSSDVCSSDLRTDPLIGVACIRHNRAVSIFPEHAAIANPCGDAEAMEQIAGQALHRVGGETDILETAIRHRIGGQSAGHGTCGRYAKIRLAIAFSYIIGRHAHARISLRSQRSSISNAGRDDVTVML